MQQALANAGVSDAYQLWPDQYQGVNGYYTDSPLAGDLIYYNNGGRGVDHIAIYIGNGQAVHGNYNGKTVIADAYQSGMGKPHFFFNSLPKSVSKTSLARWIQHESTPKALAAFIRFPIAKAPSYKYVGAFESANTMIILLAP